MILIRRDFEISFLVAWILDPHADPGFLIEQTAVTGDRIVIIKIAVLDLERIIAGKREQGSVTARDQRSARFVIGPDQHPGREFHGAELIIHPLDLTDLEMDLVILQIDGEIEFQCRTGIGLMIRVFRKTRPPAEPVEMDVQSLFIGCHPMAAMFPQIIRIKVSIAEKKRFFGFPDRSVLGLLDRKRSVIRQINPDESIFQ